MKNKKKNNSPKTGDNANDKARRNLKKLGILLLNFILFYALFKLLTELSEQTMTIGIYYATSIVYAAATSALIVAFFVLNGFSFDKKPRTWDELPDKWTDEKKKDFLAKQPERKEKAKNLLYILMPLVVTLLVSYIELNFFK